MVFKSLKLILVSLISLTLLGSCATTEENKELAYNHFKIGATLLAKNEKEKALEQLRKAHELDPSNKLILNHLGLTYFFMGEYEQAVITFKKSIAEDQNYSEAHNNLGRTFIDMKDYAAARKHLTIAARDLTYPHKDKVWFNLGLTYFQEGDYKQSQNYFLKSISVNRENCLAYNYYGRTHIELSAFEEASKALDQAIYHCRKKGFDEPHYYGAISLFRLGYKSKAIARLQEGRKLFPRGPNKKKMDEMINLMKITDAQ